MQKLRKTLYSINAGRFKRPVILCISLIMIVSMLFIFSASIVKASTTANASCTFGNTAIGTVANYFATDKDASRFQLTESGTLQSITTYFANTGFNAKAAIYTDNNGKPYKLMAQSNAQAITTSGWQTFAVPQISLTAGTYWLCVVSNSYSSRGAMTVTSTDSHTWKNSDYSEEFTSTFGIPNAYEKTVTSIYATYIPASSTSTSTPSSTDIQNSTSLNSTQTSTTSSTNSTNTSSTQTSNSSTASSTSTYSGLHVEGSKLKDANGNTVILRGVDDSCTTWYDAGVGYDSAQFAYMKAWGCNAVRINIGMWDIGYKSGKLGVYNDAAFWTRLDSQINAAVANGITPIICGWHAILSDCPDGSDSINVAHFMSTYHTWNDYITVYTMLAQRYAGKGVIYEMYNEPLYCSLATYKIQMEATVDAIRVYDPNAIVVVQAVGTGGWDTQSLQFVQNSNYRIYRSNIVYCAHIYAWQLTSNTESAIRGKLSSGYYNLYASQALAAGYPVIFTEFGCGGNGGDYDVHVMNSWSATWLTNFMAVCDSDGYSGYTAWRWCTSSYDVPWNLLSDWKGNPTAYGTAIKNYYLSRY